MALCKIAHMTEKRCPQCQKTKNVDAFYRRTRTYPSGNKNVAVASWCQECARADARKRMSEARKTPEGAARHREATYKSRAKNGGRKAERDRAKVIFEGRQMTHREAVEIRRERRELRKAQKKVEQLARRRSREAARAKEIAEKPWLDPKLNSSEKFALRYKLDEEFNIKQRLRTRMRRKIKNYKLGDLARDAIVRKGSSPKFEDFAGYTIKELRDHLERQFTKGMNWDQFCAGKIHIDHIVPLSAFDLKNEDELKAAWAITNLRPLWAKDNLQKSDNRDFLL